jgi:hypothetical protein
MALESIFEALESIFEVGFEFFGVFRLGLAGNGGSRLGQPSPMSAVAGEVRGRREEEKNQGKKRA